MAKETLNVSAPKNQTWRVVQKTELATVAGGGDDTNWDPVCNPPLNTWDLYNMGIGRFPSEGSGHYVISASDLSGLTETQCITMFSTVGTAAGLFVTRSRAGAAAGGAVGGWLGGLVCGSIVDESNTR